MRQCSALVTCFSEQDEGYVPHVQPDADSLLDHYEVPEVPVTPRLTDDGEPATDLEVPLTQEVSDSEEAGKVDQPSTLRTQHNFHPSLYVVRQRT